jgi:hypothetical protein
MELEQIFITYQLLILLENTHSHTQAILYGIPTIENKICFIKEERSRHSETQQCSTPAGSFRNSLTVCTEPQQRSDTTCYQLLLNSHSPRLTS